MIISPINKPLYVVTSVFNPMRFKSRYKLYNDFKKHVEDAGAVLYTIECALGERPFEVTQKNVINNDQVRTFSELWLKENMLNLAIQNLPEDWEYVAWVDADIIFSRPDWVQEPIQKLQHYQFVQMFSHAIDMGPSNQPIKTHRGFVHSWYHGLKTSGKYYEMAHPGFAWGARREALDDVGGLIDWAILGSADRHMAAALIGEAQTTLNRNLTKEYKDMILEWENRATKYIKHDIGYVDGTILHHWHGSKKNRKYSERWKILTDNKFNPYLDLKKDSQGLYQLTDRNLNLRDDIRRYFAERNEDSIDL